MTKPAAIKRAAMTPALLALLLTANTAFAADFCATPPDQALASLAGQWSGIMRGAIVVQEGRPQVLPAETAEDALDIVLTPDGATLTLSEEYDFFPTISLAPATDLPDYALPGESALTAAELLAPEVAEAKLTCDPATLPQFQTDVPMEDGPATTIRLVALSPDLLVMVIQARGEGQAARALFDLRRR